MVIRYPVGKECGTLTLSSSGREQESTRATICGTRERHERETDVTPNPPSVTFTKTPGSYFSEDTVRYDNEVRENSPAAGRY